jgi:UTP--glucose-1-phosphate uridylyltransferase
MRELLKTRPFYALEVDGVRHDAGNKLGFLKATAYFGLKRPDVSEAFVQYLKTLGFERK